MMLKVLILPINFSKTGGVGFRPKFCVFGPIFLTKTQNIGGGSCLLPSSIATTPVVVGTHESIDDFVW